MGSLAFDEGYARLVRARRDAVMARVAQACAQAGRDAGQVEVCAVSKTVDVPQVAAALHAGYTSFAENRPQELERKLGLIGDDPAFGRVRWHMIGNLQENKINHVLACRPVLVHSIASPKLAAAVSRRAQASGLVQPVLLEVNVSGEDSKQGMSPEGLRAAFDEVAQLGGIEVRGLMTMAPQGDPACAERTFEGLRLLRDELSEAWSLPLPVLSMGMSEDFEAAIRQGATIIRLGRVVFDPAFPFEERL